jgi:hypothetical protein
MVSQNNNTQMGKRKFHLYEYTHAFSQGVMEHTVQVAQPGQQLASLEGVAGEYVTN